MKIAIIHDTRKIRTGAHHINELIVSKLRQKGVEVREFYPKVELLEAPHKMKGLVNILFFFSLLEHKDEISKCDLIQGTTYTPLTYLAFPIPIVCHFGSTTAGFLKNTPRTNGISDETKTIFYKLKEDNVINTLNIKSWKPLHDVADIECYVAQRGEGVIAVSEIVKQNLIDQGVAANKIHVIHNAIEDYWYEKNKTQIATDFNIVYLGRIGDDPFTWKLKGFDRLIHLFQNFPQINKYSFLMTSNTKIEQWLTRNIANHKLFINMIKNEIKDRIAPLKGGVFFLPSRYEGFSLSLVEAMSQGLIPISYPVGVATEIIRQGVNGFIVNNQKQVIKIINKLRNNREMRRELSGNAIITAKKFNADKMVNEFIILYKSILNSNKNRSDL